MDPLDTVAAIAGSTDQTRRGADLHPAAIPAYEVRRLCLYPWIFGAEAMSQTRVVSMNRPTTINRTAVAHLANGVE